MLTNVLHVPDITKNLISISQFLKDNKAFIKFHSSFCVVKDLITHKPLLRGVLNNGLLQLDLSHFRISTGLLSNQNKFTGVVVNSSPQCNNVSDSVVNN